MLAANDLQNKKLSHPSARFPIGLRTACKVLGYNPSHLSRVIKGERISPPTLRAYEALVAEMKAQIKTGKRVSN
jgi:hypothetical protein